jgi:magnesium chelatase subunit D
MSISWNLYGRYRNLLPNEKINDIAFDATLKASLIESSRSKEPFQIKPHHYKIKIRKSPTNVLIIFLLDSSGSMAPNKRMSAAKGAIYSLMEEIYIRKDKICLITFSGSDANLVLPPTNSIDLASNLLEQIPTGGKPH